MLVYQRVHTIEKMRENPGKPWKKRENTWENGGLVDLEWDLMGFTGGFMGVHGCCAYKRLKKTRRANTPWKQIVTPTV